MVQLSLNPQQLSTVINRGTIFVVLAFHHLGLRVDFIPLRTCLYIEAIVQSVFIGDFKVGVLFLKSNFASEASEKKFAFCPPHFSCHFYGMYPPLF